MAAKMIKCKTCGTDIAANAKACPSCGAKNKKPIFKRVWFWALVVILLAAIGSGMGGDTDTTSGEVTAGSDVAETSDPAESPEENRTPMVVTADELVSALESNALKADKTYSDQYVELTGKLSNIDSDGNYFSLEPLDGAFTMTTIMCNITEEQQDVVMEFDKDQTVTIIGTITDVGEVLGYQIQVESFK